MNKQQEKAKLAVQKQVPQLIRRAVRLYPLVPDATSQVRHNRREWVKAIQFLRGESNRGWELDKFTPLEKKPMVLQ